MTMWKRLTGATDGKSVDVNMEQVAFLKVDAEGTRMVYVGGRSLDGKGMVMYVKETPDEILKPDKSSTARGDCRSPC